MIKEETGTSSLTMVFEGGKRVYPCRCGKTHRGDYAEYDFGHHNCLHEASLIGFPAGKNEVQAICPVCGMSWLVNIEEV